MAANTECRIPFQILNGAQAGPVLCLESTLHGWEPVGAEIIRRALQRVDPADVSGAVLALPLAHPFAVEFGGNIEGAGVRTSPSDNLDLNRVWPGKRDGAGFPTPNGWLTEQMAYAMWNEVVKKADYLIDFHDGTGSCDELPVAFPQGYPDGEQGCRPDLTEQVRELAKAFGSMVTWWRGGRGLNTTMISGSFAANGGVPMVVEAGGASAFDETVDMAVENVLNVMKHLKMIDGELVLPKRQIFVDNYVVYRSVAGGYYLAEPEVKLGAEVKKGQVLGRVIDPLTSEEREVTRSQVNGIIISRRIKMPINPGGYIAHIADTDAIIWERGR
jgi:predicted deacylase